MTDFEAYKTVFGHRLKELVTKRGLVSSDFAEIIGRSDSSSITKIYRGERLPSIDFLVSIKEALPDFDIDYLVYGTSKPTGPAVVSAREILEKQTPSSLAGHAQEPAPTFANRYKELYEHNQQTIAALQAALKAKDELIEVLKSAGKAK